MVRLLWRTLHTFKRVTPDVLEAIAVRIPEQNAESAETRRAAERDCLEQEETKGTK